MAEEMPSPSILELEGYRLEEALPTFDELTALLDRDESLQTFQWIAQKDHRERVVRLLQNPGPWSLPVRIWKGSESVGVAFTSLLFYQNLAAEVQLAMVSRANSALPLAMYVRHLFWNFPIHQLSLRLPLANLARPHHEICRLAGFREEAELRRTQLVAGELVNTVVYGVTRPEFAAFCTTMDDRLVL